MEKATKTKRQPAQKGTLAPQKLKLLVTVVNRAKGEFYLDLLQSFEVNMQLSLAANGTANTEMLNMLGLSDSEKVVIFSVIREDLAKPALLMLEEKFRTIKNGKGIAYTIPMSSVIGVAIYQFLCNNDDYKIQLNHYIVQPLPHPSTILYCLILL